MRLFDIMIKPIALYCQGRIQDLGGGGAKKFC